MDVSQYKREIDKLEKESAALDTTETTNVQSPDGIKGLLKYKIYVGIIILAFVALLIIQPKVVLKMVLIDNTPAMIVDKRKFVLWWLLVSAVLSAGYFISKKFRKSTNG